MERTTYTLWNNGTIKDKAYIDNNIVSTGKEPDGILGSGGSSWTFYGGGSGLPPFVIYWGSDSQIPW